MAKTPIPEELVTLIRLLNEDESLRRWFLGLEKLPANLRSLQILQIAAQMEKDKQDADLVAAVKLLANVLIFQAARETLRDFFDI